MSSTVSNLEDLRATAEDLCNDIFCQEKHENLNRSRLLSVALAGLRSQGWQGDTAQKLALATTDGEGDMQYALRQSSSITDPWKQLSDWSEDPSIVNLFQRLLRQNAPTAHTSGATVFDLDAEPTGARWIVPPSDGNNGLIERGFVTAISGDTGASKSIFRDGITAAGLRGEKFLGRQINGDRFMVIDGENPQNVAQARMKALGITNDDWPRLHFTGREGPGGKGVGVLLGQPEWDEWLHAEVESFHPDVIFVDSVAKCCAVSLLDNDSVIALYRDVLVPIVSKFDCALVLTLHERKGRGGGAGDRSQDAMGARQWIDQADAHITLAPTAKFTQDGDRTQRSFALRNPKNRWASEDKAEHYEIVGTVREDQTPTSLDIRHPQAKPTNEEKLVAALGEDYLGRAELAERAGLNATGSAFRTALTKTLGDARIIKDDDGLYHQGDA